MAHVYKDCLESLDVHELMIRLQVLYTSEFGNGSAKIQTFYSDVLQPLEHDVGKIKKIADNIASVTKIKHNGYRSFVRSYRNVLLLLEQRLKEYRKMFVFWKWPSNGLSGVEKCHEWLEYYALCLHYLLKLSRLCPDGSLLPCADQFIEAQSLYLEAQNMTIRQCPTTLLDMHLTEDQYHNAKARVWCTLIHLHYYFSSGNGVIRLSNTIRSLCRSAIDKNNLDRMKRMYFGRLEACWWKATSYLCDSGYFGLLMSLTKPSVAVNVQFGLTQNVLTLDRSFGDTGQVLVHPPPSVNESGEVVRCRLLSARRRSGMLGNTGWLDRVHGTCSALIIHCHGGGFVMGSSRGHEIYLRHWAQRLNAPIFSIDYSLSPKHEFPRACEEVFYAYCWALKHSYLLGSTIEQIIVVGDSSGADLLFNVVLESIRREVRAPDSVFLIYPLLNVSKFVTPSRFMGTFDSTLKMQTLLSLLEAYMSNSRTYRSTSDVDQSSSAANEVDSAYILNLPPLPLDVTLPDISLDSLIDISNTLELQNCPGFPHDYRLCLDCVSDELLSRFPERVSIVVGEFDTLLDDSVILTSRLRSLGIPVKLSVLKNISHNFLFHENVDDCCKLACKFVMDSLERFLSPVYTIDILNSDK